jgi:hypothetical protein
MRKKEKTDQAGVLKFYLTAQPYLKTYMGIVAQPPTSRASSLCPANRLVWEQQGSSNPRSAHQPIIQNLRTQESKTGVLVVMQPPQANTARLCKVRLCVSDRDDTANHTKLADLGRT